ncbi:tetratricopeptide repeat protein [Thalassobius sp. MITS945101]|uniref:tetratricopeptide repeat protein n=1 Tax=Thalassobius sp. MITS945101 TaxID=3096994 RepID=UPI003999CB8C
MKKAFFNHLCCFKLMKYAALAACLSTPSFAQDNAEVVFWQTVSGSGSAEQLQAYIDAFPEGIYRALAEIQIKEIQGAAVKKAIVTNAQAQEDCDRLAGHAGDETLTVAPTSLSDLMTHAQAAIDACNSARQTSDNPRYTYQLARAFWASGDATNAWNWYVHASVSGHQRATYRLGLTYYNGNSGVTQDVPKIPVEMDAEKALAEFQRNAERGHIGSAYYAGWILATGEASGTSDFEGAYHYFKQVEDAGETDAYYALGYMYEHGLHVDASNEIAADYYERAIETKSRDWSSAQGGLLRLLVRNYNFYKENDLDYEAAVFDDLLELASEFRDGLDAISHNYYIYLIVSEMADLSKGEAILASLLWFDPNSEMTDDLRRLDALAAHLEPALNARFEAFSDQFPNQSSEAASQLAKLYWQKTKNYVLEGYRLGKFEKHQSDNPAAECLSGEINMRDGIATTTLMNNCAYEVHTQIEHRFVYNEAGYPDEIERHEATIPAGVQAWRSTSSRHSVSAKVLSQEITCYSQQGFDFVDWNSNEFRCGEYRIQDDLDYAALETEIDNLLRRIVAAGQN